MIQDTWYTCHNYFLLILFSPNEMCCPLRYPLSITNKAIIAEAKWIMLGGLLNALTHNIFIVTFTPPKCRERQEMVSIWIRYFCGPHAECRQSLHSLGGGCGDGTAAVFHFPESTHPSKNLNASLIHNTVHKDFIFPAHSDTLWRQSVLPLKSLLSRKIWSFDIQEITVICKTRLICQG